MLVGPPAHERIGAAGRPPAARPRPLRALASVGLHRQVPPRGGEEVDTTSGQPRARRSPSSRHFPAAGVRGTRQLETLLTAVSKIKMKGGPLATNAQPPDRSDGARTGRRLVREDEP